MKIHPVPNWDWGKGLPSELVTDIVDAADACNEACLLADEAQVIYRRSGAKVRPEREHLGLPRHHLGLLTDWQLTAADYCGNILRLYVRAGATFAINTARVANSLLQGTATAPVSLASGVDLLSLLTQDAAVPVLQINPDITTTSVMDRVTALRIGAELAHDHQRLEYAIEVFRRNNRETLAHGSGALGILQNYRAWIEADGPALASSFHSYAATCLWLIAGVTSNAG